MSAAHPYDGPTLHELVERVRADIRQAAPISISHVLELVARLEVEITAEVEARIDDVAMRSGYQADGLRVLPTAGALAGALKRFVGR